MTYLITTLSEWRKAGLNENEYSIRLSPDKKMVIVKVPDDAPFVDQMTRSQNAYKLTASEARQRVADWDEPTERPSKPARKESKAKGGNDSD